MIKRYALSLALGAFAVAGIGAYYVHGAVDRLPAFQLATWEGDPSAAEDMALSGSYWKRRGSAFLEVSSEGSDYMKERSLYRTEIVGSRSTMMRYPDIREMVAEHRAFMRGKGRANGFYRDEETVVYAQIDIAGGPRRPSADLGIERLDLASGKTSSHSISFELEEGVGYAIVEDVQRVGGELHVLIRASGELPNGPDTVFRVVVVDAADGRLLRNIPLDPGVDAAEGMALRLGVVAEQIPSAPGDYAVLTVREEETSSGKLLARRYYAYEYRTGELAEVASSPTNAQDSLHCGVLTRLSTSDDVVTASWLPLDTREAAVVDIERAALSADRFRNAVVIENRLYALFELGNTPSLAIFALPDGERLYRGEVVPGANATEEDLEHLHLLNFEPWRR